MREQLVTQVVLGVASGDLKVGEKLPSRQEISRRFKIHANTVSSAYQELTEQGLIEFRQGSGFYVNEASENLGDRVELDALITKFFQTAQSLGFAPDEITESLEKKLNSKTPKSFLVIESDRPLREILIDEIQRFTGRKVFGISVEDFENEHLDRDSNFVALFDEKQNIDAFLEADQTCHYLKVGSVSHAMHGETRPADDDLIAVVSGWKNFLTYSKTLLVAAKVNGDSILLRSTQDENWKRGLEGAAIIICDSVTQKSLVSYRDVRAFRLISDESINELNEIVGPKPDETVT